MRKPERTTESHRAQDVAPETSSVLDDNREQGSLFAFAQGPRVRVESA
jgi:hypothetical protein